MMEGNSVNSMALSKYMSLKSNTLHHLLTHIKADGKYGIVKSASADKKNMQLRKYVVRRVQRRNEEEKGRVTSRKEGERKSDACH